MFVKTVFAEPSLEGIISRASILVWASWGVVALRLLLELLSAVNRRFCSAPCYGKARSVCEALKCIQT